MNITLDSLGIYRMSVRERLELVDQILDTLPPSVEPEEVPAWHLAELAKWRAEAGENRRAGRPWREVLDSLNKKNRFLGDLS
jgi:hypothetical protein